MEIKTHNYAYVFPPAVVRELSEYVCNHGITCIMTLVNKCYVSIQIYGYPVCPLIYTLYLGFKQIVFVFEYSVMTTNRIFKCIL